MDSSYRFERFEVRPLERKLYRDGRVVRIGGRGFDLLVELLENRHRIVAKDELLEAAWPGLDVEESNLQVQVSALRRLLGKGSIATVARRGYQFSEVVEVEGRTEPARATLHLPWPSASEPMIGRGRESASIAEAIAEHRLVSIVGPAGIGKTRLAMDIAANVAGHFADGSWWVDLSNAAEGSESLAVANAGRLELGEGNPDARLARALAKRDVLVVLDNCERLAQRLGRWIDALLEAAPRLRFLVTSQVPIKSAPERVFRLAPLPVPPRGSTLRKARRYGAIQLLERRARAVDAQFALNEHTVEAAVALCAQLDGLPLAIEMAAPSVSTMGIEIVVANLARGLEFLKAPTRAAPARHATLRAALDCSQELLETRERSLLHAVAAFSGSFRLDCALGLAGVLGFDAAYTSEALMGLVEKSFVQVVRGEPPRYRLLDATRLHARESLARVGVTEATYAAHALVIRRLAEEIERSYWTLPDRIWLERHGADYDELESTFWRAADRRDADTAGAVGEALRWLDFERNFLSLMPRRMEAARDLLPAASDLARARLLSLLSTFRWLRVPGLSALWIARERVSAWRKVGETRQLYMALNRLGFYCAVTGEHAEARKAFHEASATWSIDCPPRTRLAHENLAALAAWYRGDGAGVQRHAKTLLGLARAFGAEHMAALARLHFARAAMAHGDFAEAARMLRANAHEFRRGAQDCNAATAMALLCGSLLRMEQVDEATKAAATAISFVPRDDLDMLLLDHGALLAARRGEAALAARILGYADGAFQEKGEIRSPAEAFSAREAARAARASMGRSQFAKQGQEGKAMGAAEAAAALAAAFQ